MSLSVVVPTLNDASSINPCLRSLREKLVSELIVVDGGSEDTSVERALEEGARVWHGPKDLAERYHLGIQKSKGEQIAMFPPFLRPDSGWSEIAQKCLNAVYVSAGTFSLVSDSPFQDWLDAWVVRYSGRVRRAGGLFFRREVYEACGGINLPLNSPENFLGHLSRAGKVVRLTHTIRFIK